MNNEHNSPSPIQTNAAPRTSITHNQLIEKEKEEMNQKKKEMNQKKKNQ